ncbi:MAG: hypothetical protein AMXMBFR37_07290 [Steroidobacteraceae bacterium]
MAPATAPSTATLEKLFARPVMVRILVSVLRYGVKEHPVTGSMTIGKFAEAAGVNVETVRYYQRVGLLAEPDTGGSGYRRYSLQELRRLRFIKRAQGLGFTLTEVGSLLTLDSARSCKATREAAANKLDLIEQRMRDLSAMRQALTDLVERCDSKGDREGCPLIDALAED